VTRQRWVVLGLAHPRADWFAELARWATSAAIPIDFIKCMSASEVNVRLSAGRAYSALLVGDRVSGFDRDLVDSATAVGTAVIVVDPMTDRDWSDLGVAGVIHTPLGRSEVLSTLQQHATPVKSTSPSSMPESAAVEGSWRGRLIGVTGPGGAGKSVISMALCQALCSTGGNRSMVLLADLALRAEQAMLHDARDVVPGVQEIVEAHRTGRMTIERTRSMVFDTGDRGYHLLLGLRHHRDWTALRRRSFEAALDTLTRSYRLVVADITDDLEGESETGSADIGDRNLMSRSVIERSDVVVVVGTHGLKGIHSMSLTIRGLLSHGIEPERLVTVVNRSPRSRARRSEDQLTLATLLGSASGSDRLTAPLFVPDRRDLEASLRDGLPLPSQIGSSLARELQRLIDSTLSRIEPSTGPEPEVVVPGSLGTWTEETG